MPMSDADDDMGTVALTPVRPHKASTREDACLLDLQEQPQPTPRYFRARNNKPQVAKFIDRRCPAYACATANACMQ